MTETESHKQLERPMPHVLRPTLDEYVQQLERLERVTPALEEAIEKAHSIRDQHDTVFYLAGPLTGMSDEVKDRYARLSELVAQQESMFGYAPHLHGTDPIKHPDVSPNEVRDIDYLFAAVIPDLHINSLYPIAHGNGIEAGWAELAGIPSLYLVPDDITLSRLVRGMHNIADTITYADFEAEALPQVESFLCNLQRATAGQV